MNEKSNPQSDHVPEHTGESGPDRLPEDLIGADGKPLSLAEEMVSRKQDAVDVDFPVEELSLIHI